MAELQMLRVDRVKKIASMFLLFIILTYTFGRLGEYFVTIPGFILDWEMYWKATHNFSINYEGVRIFNPPWTLALLWPITIWPFAVSGGFFVFSTLVTLALSVPRKSNLFKWGSYLLLLSLSYPAARQLVDGNMEFLIILGVLLFLWALETETPWAAAASLILLSSKPQESWLLLLSAALWVLLKWPREKIAKVAALSVIYVVPFLIWKWPAWFEALRRFPIGSDIDSSIWGALSRFELPEPVIFGSWIVVLLATLWGLQKGWSKLRNHEVAMLITASMLLAPYSGSSFLVPFVIGVFPVLQSGSFVGYVLLALYYLPYLFLGQTSIRAEWEYTYWTGVLLLTWAALLWMIRAGKLSEKQSLPINN